MTPLRWPASFQPPERSSWLKKLFFARKNYAIVTQDLKQQILARPRPELSVWGSDPLRIKIGQTVCKLAQEIYDWPNDHFLPEDPFDIVFLVPWDDLDIIEAAIQLEENLSVSIDDTEAMAWIGTTLSNVVDTLLAKCRATTQ